jgi:SAM-dependent methyltransferase
MDIRACATPRMDVAVRCSVVAEPTTASPSDPRADIQSALERASSYNDWIAGQARAHLGRRILDAGCGPGNLTRLVLDRDFVVAVDEWPEFVERMERLAAEVGNLAVHRLDLADPSLPEVLAPYELDSAMCINVLEHIEDDRAALRNFAAVLPPGSPVFLLVPAFQAIYGEHDRADHHFRRYTKRSLRRTLDGLPLEIESQHYMNFPGFFAWFVLGRVLRRQVGSEEVSLYDRIVPAIRGVESRLSPPVGQSLVALLRTTARP